MTTFKATGATAVGRSAYNGNTDFVNGSIDDVRVLGRALTASEVAALAAG